MGATTLQITAFSLMTFSTMGLYVTLDVTNTLHTNFILNAAFFAVMLSVVMLSVVMLSVVMLSVIMLRVVMLSVIMLVSLC